MREEKAEHVLKRNLSSILCVIGKTVIGNNRMKHVVSKGCLRASGDSEAPDFQGCSGPHCHLLKSLGYIGTARGTLKWPVSLSEGLQLLPA